MSFFSSIVIGFNRTMHPHISDTFPGKWIGTRLLYPLDFVLWGYCKNDDYRGIFVSEDQEKKLVIDAFENFTPVMLGRLLNRTVRWFYLCLENNGHLFEES